MAGPGAEGGSGHSVGTRWEGWAGLRFQGAANWAENALPGSWGHGVGGGRRGSEAVGSRHHGESPSSPPPLHCLQCTTAPSDFTNRTRFQDGGCRALSPKPGALLSLGACGTTLAMRSQCPGYRSGNKEARRGSALPTCEAGPTHPN